jgi:hypothetical protein
MVFELMQYPRDRIFCLGSTNYRTNADSGGNPEIQRGDGNALCLHVHPVRQSGLRRSCLYERYHPAANEENLREHHWENASLAISRKGASCLFVYGPDVAFEVLFASHLQTTSTRQRLPNNGSTLETHYT